MIQKLRQEKVKVNLFQSASHAQSSHVSKQVNIYVFRGNSVSSINEAATNIEALLEIHKFYNMLKNSPVKISFKG